MCVGGGGGGRKGKGGGGNGEWGSAQRVAGSPDDDRN